MVLSHFLPANHAITRHLRPDLLPVSSFVPPSWGSHCHRRTSAYIDFRLEGWAHRGRHFRLVETERGCHGDLRSGLHPSDTPPTIWPTTYPSLCLHALDKGVDHLAREFRKGHPRRMGGEKLMIRRETPWVSVCISWKDPRPSECHSSYYIQCTQDLWYVSVCERAHAHRNSRFSWSSLCSRRIVCAACTWKYFWIKPCDIFKDIREANAISKSMTFQRD